MTLSYANAVKLRHLYKPFRCKDVRRDSDALVQDVVEALSQILAGLPYIIEAKTRILDSDGEKREVDVLVRDRKSRINYSIIECKSISSDEGSTYETQIARAYRHLAGFGENQSLLRICVVRKKTKIGNRIDNDFRRIGVTLHDWSDSLDWMRMALSIRGTILSWIGEEEDIETYYKFLSYYGKHLAGSKRKTGDFVEFLTNIGYKTGQARGAVYKFKHHNLEPLS